jgi:type II secretory pathway component PulM
LVGWLCRASFIEQINKQFKEEEKLLATVQTMKNEFEELRATYTQTVSKLQDSR